MKITNLNDFTHYALSEIPEFYDLSLDEKIDEIYALLDGLGDHELIAVYNDEVEMSNNLCHIHDISELNDYLSRRSPEDIIQMTNYGDANLNDSYFMVDDLDQLYTGNCLSDFSITDVEELAKDIVNYYLDA